MTPGPRFVMLWALAQAGCATSAPERFYVLTDVAKAPPSAAGSISGSLVVDPVLLPELVDRPQFVIRTGGARVMLLEQQRWAEPLRAGVARLMAVQLARLLGTKTVSSNDGVLARPDYRITVDIRRLDSTPGQGVTVEALWSVDGPSGTNQRGYSRGEAPSPEGDYDALVAAIGLALGTVSRDIAGAVTVLSTPSP